MSSSNPRIEDYCPDIDNGDVLGMQVPWCLVNERGAGYCLPWLPYPSHDWINYHGGYYEVRCRPDSREVLVAHWPRCNEMTWPCNCAHCLVARRVGERNMVTPLTPQQQFWSDAGRWFFYRKHPIYNRCSYVQS